MKVADEKRLQRLIDGFAPYTARNPTAARLVAQALQQLEDLRRRPDLYNVRRACVRTQPQPATDTEEYDGRS